jgi:hypothetical protein
MSRQFSLPGSIAAFDTGLRQILTTSSYDREADIASLAMQYSQRGLVYQMIKSICADDSLMSSCAQRSARHPLGFDKFVLYATDAYQLRIHVWWPGETHGTEHIHNHRFSFVSGIIAGKIHVASYRLARKGVSYARFREKKYPDDGMYEYHPYGNVQIGLASLQMLCPGSVYYLDSRELHRVQAADDRLSATLFIRLSQIRASTDVLVDTGGKMPTSGLRDSMAIDAARRRLESFASVMGRRGSWSSP